MVIPEAAENASLSEVPDSAYSDDFEQATGSKRVGTPATEKGVKLKEQAAYEFITVQSMGANGGIESPFVSNKKQLVKFQLTHEMI